MQIVAAADKSLRPIVKKNLEYDPKVYDLGGLGFGEEYNTRDGDLTPTEGDYGFPPCIFKINIIQKELQDNDSVMWLDGDAIIQKPIDGIPENDIVLTERREDGNSFGRINAGVMFFNDTPTEFFGVWRGKALQANSDQRALNDMLDSWDIGFVPTEKYNNYYFDETQDDAYVVHYKGQKKERVI